VIGLAVDRGTNRLRVPNLQPAPKYADYGVVRVIPPEETIRRILPLLEAIGVTRVADVTGLDRTGIPNFTTVRPREPGYGISYYNGKGVTRSAAKAGALMEALERHSGESCDLPVHRATRAEMNRRGPTVDPNRIVEPRVVEYRPEMQLEWIEGYDLLGDHPTFVPLNAVVCPYQPPDRSLELYYAHTNGLASGNTIEEALCHAICEVLERDAVGLANAAEMLAFGVARVYREAIGEPIQDPLPVTAPRGRWIELDTLPERAAGVAQKMQDADLLVYLRDVTSSIGIATFDCACVERKLDGRHWVHAGSGSHPDARVAVSRALTEAAQSRVAHIQGGREDLTHIIRSPAPFEPDEAFGTGERCEFGTVESREHANVDDDIRFLLGRLSAAGFEHVIAVDLTRPELGVPVVRVLIPGAETWSVFFTHGHYARLGARANRILWETVCTL
jgi:ribosomal protein S12 methylthiotransferase accessory factor YcaO